MIFNASGLGNKMSAILEAMAASDVDYAFTKYHHDQKNTSSHPFLAASSRPVPVRINVPTKHGIALLASDTMRDEKRTHNIIVNLTEPTGRALIWTIGQICTVHWTLPPACQK